RRGRGDLPLHRGRRGIGRNLRESAAWVAGVGRCPLGAFRREAACVAAGVEQVLGRTPGQPAEEAPRPVLVAVGQDRERRFVLEKLVVAAQAEPTAEATGALGV